MNETIIMYGRAFFPITKGLTPLDITTGIRASAPLGIIHLKGLTFLDTIHLTGLINKNFLLKPKDKIKKLGRVN